MATQKQAQSPTSTQQSSGGSGGDKGNDNSKEPVRAPEAELALAEFTNIATTIGLRFVSASYKQSRLGCKEEPCWYLPDPACSAKLTLSQEEAKFIKSHVERYAPKDSNESSQVG